jgi:hypothetical protein
MEVIHMSHLRNLPDQTRKTIFDILTRANNDETYKQQLDANPVATLEAAGLSSDVAEQVKAFNPETDAETGDVEGYMRCQDGTCWDITFRSICPGTCFITWP